MRWRTRVKLLEVADVVVAFLFRNGMIGNRKCVCIVCNWRVAVLMVDVTLAQASFL